MFRIPRVSISMRELDRLKCIQGLIDKQLKQKAVAERLGLTVRQVRRLVERYELEGPRGLISKLRDRPGNRRLKPERAEEDFAVIRAQYADFGPTLAAEKLRERHGIDLAVETVRSLMTAGGLWLPRRLRPPKVQQPRSRRACIGELVQIDGCEHAWFEDRAPQCTALVYVDDATSRLMVVLFGGSESTFGYFEATRQYIHRYGKPMALYSDKASIFRVNHKTATNGKGHTQFARALFELNIEGLCANTPGAKGRVERAHLTLQDRLVKELRLQGISTIDAANEFMPSFIEDYNRRFGKLPRDRHDAHRPVREDEDLDLTFSWHEARKVTSNLTLQYERKIYMRADNSENRRLIGKYIDVLQFPNEPPCLTRKIVITENGLLALRETEGSIWIAFEDIIDATAEPDEKTDHSPNIYLTLRSGEEAIIPITGGQGNLQDKYEFLRFLMRVADDSNPDLKPELDKSSAAK